MVLPATGAGVCPSAFGRRTEARVDAGATTGRAASQRLRRASQRHSNVRGPDGKFQAEQITCRIRVYRRLSAAYLCAVLNRYLSTHRPRSAVTWGSETLPRQPPTMRG